MSDIHRQSQALRSRNADNRRKAIHSLARSSHPKALKLLRWAARNDPDAELQILAQKAVTYIEKRQASDATPSAPAQKSATPQAAQNTSTAMPTNEDRTRQKVTHATDTGKPNLADAIMGGLIAAWMVAILFLPPMPFIELGDVPLQSGGTVNTYVNEYRQRINLAAPPYNIDMLTIGLVLNGVDNITSYLFSFAEKEQFEAQGIDIPDPDTGIDNPEDYRLQVFLTNFAFLSMAVHGILGMGIFFYYMPIRNALISTVRWLLSFLHVNLLWSFILLVALASVGMIIAMPFVVFEPFVEESLGLLGLQPAPYEPTNLLGGRYFVMFGYHGGFAVLALVALLIRMPSDDTTDTA